MITMNSSTIFTVFNIDLIKTLIGQFNYLLCFLFYINLFFQSRGNSFIVSNKKAEDPSQQNESHIKHTHHDEFEFNADFVKSIKSYFIVIEYCIEHDKE